MKVWMINQYAVPASQAGGTRHYALAKELTEKGHDVTIIASSFDHLTRKERTLSEGAIFKEEMVDRVRFLWLRTPPYPGNTTARIKNMLTFAWRVWRETGMRQLEKPDVIVASSPQLFAALASLKLAKRYSIPFILEIRDLWPQSFIDLGSYSTRHPLIKGLEFIERHLYKKANRIISLLPGAIDHMVSKGADRERIHWLPNGVDLAMFPETDVPNEKSVFEVMYAGTHGHANALDSLLDTASILQKEGMADRLLFRFVGDGPEKIRLQQRAKNEGISIVRFEAPVPKSQVAAVMAEADAFIVTLRDSKLYRWGISLNKLYDYLAMKRPIIFGASAFNNPVLEASSGLTVPPENPVAMAEAVKAILQMTKEQRAAMASNGREHVAAHYSFTAIGNKLESLLIETAYEKSGKQPQHASVKLPFS